MSDAGIVEQLNRGTLQRVTGHFNQVMNWLVKLLSGSKEVTYPPPQFGQCLSQCLPGTREQ